MDLTSPLSVCYLSAVKLFARPQGFPNYNGQNNEAWVLAERHGKRTHTHTHTHTHKPPVAITCIEYLLTLSLHHPPLLNTHTHTHIHTHTHTHTHTHNT